MGTSLVRRVLSIAARSSGKHLKRLQSVATYLYHLDDLLPPLLRPITQRFEQSTENVEIGGWFLVDEPGGSLQCFRGDLGCCISRSEALGEGRHVDVTRPQANLAIAEFDSLAPICSS
jgi:hypothetical protein